MVALPPRAEAARHAARIRTCPTQTANRPKANGMVVPCVNPAASPANAAASQRRFIAQRKQSSDNNNASESG